MKVKKIKVHNVKAIADQELDLNGATVIVMGGNNKGKSTLLRALKDRLLKIKPDEIVKKGETDGLYVMEFTSGDRIEWEVTTKTKAGEKLTLISKDGTKTSAITDIIKWFGPSDFDIDKFFYMQPAQQRKALEKLLGVDLSAIDEQYAKAVQERRDANRDVERIEAMYAGKYADDTLPKVPLPVDHLEKQLLSVELVQERYDSAVEEETRLEAQLAQLKAQMDRINTRLGEIDEFLTEPANKPKSVEEIESIKRQIGLTKETNLKIQENNKMSEQLIELEKLREVAHHKEMAVQDITAKRDALIRESKLPAGFSFGDEGILYNGLPLTREQLSSSAIYIAALKLASLNLGNVRMLHFDASMLDNKSLMEVRDWAESQDLQLGIEIVERDGSDIRYEIIEDDWVNS